VLIAFISDVHGNLPALEAVLADVEKRGAEMVFCAGDLTGYGPLPDGVCKLLQKRRIPAVAGNYDRKVTAVSQKGLAAARDMKEKKRKILLWTVENLSPQAHHYLSRLPEKLEEKLSSGQELLIVHGSPVSLDDAVYPSITGAGLAAKMGDRRPDILVCGHTHIPFVKRVNGILVINCGSAGHPVDGDPRPSYALVRLERGSVLRGRIIRFAYDWNMTAAVLEKTTLPKGLKKDFVRGTKRRFLV